MKIVSTVTPSSFFISIIISIVGYTASRTSVAAFSISTTSYVSSFKHISTSLTSSTTSTALSESFSSSSPSSSCTPSDDADDTKDITNDTNSDLNSNPKNLKSRRSAISTAAGIITSGIVAPRINHVLAADEPQQQKKKQPSLYSIVNKIEKESYFGPDIQKIKNREPMNKPNSNGAPEKHLPKVTINGNDIEVAINHVMTEEHYIQFIWLREAKSDDVVVVKACTPEEEKPFLNVRVPSGVTLTPCLYCNLHGLWRGEPFTVA